MKFLFRFIDRLRRITTEPESDYDPKEIAIVKGEDGNYEVQ